MTKNIYAAFAVAAAVAALWGCGSSPSPLADLRAGRSRDIVVELTNGRKLAFRAGDYRFVAFDSSYAIVGKCTQIEDRFGPSSIVLTDSIPSADIDGIEGYDAAGDEGPTGWYIDALKVVVPLGVVVGIMLL